MRLEVIVKSEEVKPINAFTVEEIVLLCYNLHGNKYEGGDCLCHKAH